MSPRTTLRHTLPATATATATATAATAQLPPPHPKTNPFRRSRAEELRAVKAANAAMLAAMAASAAAKPVLVAPTARRPGDHATAACAVLEPDSVPPPSLPPPERPKKPPPTRSMRVTHSAFSGGEDAERTTIALAALRAGSKTREDPPE
jgi:hypothetical protein